VTGMMNWANSRDPILQRYGVGGVARAAVSSAGGLAAVTDAGGLKALVSAVSQDDPQAQCFAAAALGEQLWRVQNCSSSHMSIFDSSCVCCHNYAWMYGRSACSCGLFACDELCQLLYAKLTDCLCMETQGGCSPLFGLNCGRYTHAMICTAECL